MKWWSKQFEMFYSLNMYSYAQAKTEGCNNRNKLNQTKKKTDLKQPQQHECHECEMTLAQ